MTSLFPEYRSLLPAVSACGTEDGGERVIIIHHHIYTIYSSHCHLSSIRLVEEGHLFVSNVIVSVCRSAVMSSLIYVRSLLDFREHNIAQQMINVGTDVFTVTAFLLGEKINILANKPTLQHISFHHSSLNFFFYKNKTNKQILILIDYLLCFTLKKDSLVPFANIN